VEAKAIAVSPNKSSATFRMIRVRKGRFPWKQFAAASYANLPQDLEATTLPPDPDHPRIVYVPTFEPGATYILWGNKVTKVQKFRGLTVRLDILGVCSGSREVAPPPPVATTVAIVFALRRNPNPLVGRLGVFTGMALPLFFVAFNNRHGPGNVCNGARLRCHEEWSPWPWRGAAVVLLGIGMTLKARRK
jgi:hypothetical protein